MILSIFFLLLTHRFGSFERCQIHDVFQKSDINFSIPNDLFIDIKHHIQQAPGSSYKNVSGIMHSCCHSNLVLIDTYFTPL